MSGANVVTSDCPHCNGAKASFAIQSFYHKPGTNPTTFVGLGVCALCQDAAIFYITTNGTPPGHIGGNLRGSPYVTGIRVSPEPEVLESPLHTPENVSRFFAQGLDAFYRSNWDSAGTMFRKALDASLKKLHPEGKGTLAARIDNLPVDRGVTPAMKEWAHEIRDLGNDAAHEDERFDAAECVRLKEFTETFLTHMFTMPGMLSEKRKLAIPGAG